MDMTNPTVFYFVLTLAVVVDAWVMYDVCKGVYLYIKEVF